MSAPAQNPQQAPANQPQAQTRQRGQPGNQGEKEKEKNNYDALKSAISESKGNINSLLSRLNSNPDKWYNDYSNKNDNDIKKKPVEFLNSIKLNIINKYTDMNVLNTKINTILSPYYNNFYTFFTNIDAPLIVKNDVIYKSNVMINLHQSSVIKQFNIGDNSLIPFIFRSKSIIKDKSFTNNFISQVKTLLNPYYNLNTKYVLPHIFYKKFISILNNNFDYDFDFNFKTYLNDLHTNQKNISLSDKIKQIEYKGNDKKLFNDIALKFNISYNLSAPTELNQLQLDDSEYNFYYLKSGTAPKDILNSGGGKSRYTIRCFYFFDNDLFEKISKTNTEILTLQKEIEKIKKEKENIESAIEKLQKEHAKLESETTEKQTIKDKFVESVQTYESNLNLIKNLKDNYDATLTARNNAFNPDETPKHPVAPSGALSPELETYNNAINELLEKINSTIPEELEKTMKAKITILSGFTTTKANPKKIFHTMTWNNFINPLDRSLDDLKQRKKDGNENQEYIKSTKLTKAKLDELTAKEAELTAKEAELTAKEAELSAKQKSELEDTNIFIKYNFWYLDNDNVYHGYTFKNDKLIISNESENIPKNDMLNKTTDSTTGTDFLVLIENNSFIAPEPVPSAQAQGQAQAQAQAQGQGQATSNAQAQGQGQATSNAQAQGQQAPLPESANAGSQLTLWKIPTPVRRPVFTISNTGGGNHTSTGKTEIDPDKNFLYTSVIYFLAHIPNFVDELKKITQPNFCTNALKDVIITVPTKLSDYGKQLDEIDEKCNKDFTYQEPEYMINDLLRDSADKPVKEFVDNYMRFGIGEFSCEYDENTFCKVYKETPTKTSVNNIIFDLTKDTDSKFIINRKEKSPPFIITKENGRPLGKIFFKILSSVGYYLQEYIPIATIFSRMIGDKKIYSVLLLTYQNDTNPKFFYADKTIEGGSKQIIKLSELEQYNLTIEYNLNVKNKKPNAFTEDINKLDNISPTIKPAFVKLQKFKDNMRIIEKLIEFNPSYSDKFSTSINLIKENFGIETTNNIDSVKLNALLFFFEQFIKDYYEPKVTDTKEKDKIKLIKTNYIPKIRTELTGEKYNNNEDKYLQFKLYIFNLLNTSIDYILNNIKQSDKSGIWTKIKSSTKISNRYSPETLEAGLTELNEKYKNFTAPPTNEIDVIEQIKILTNIIDAFKILYEMISLINVYKISYKSDKEKLSDIQDKEVKYYQYISSSKILDLYNYYINGEPNIVIKDFVNINDTQTSVTNINKACIELNTKLIKVDVPSMIINSDINKNDSIKYYPNDNKIEIEKLNDSRVPELNSKGKPSTIGAYSINIVNIDPTEKAKLMGYLYQSNNLVPKLEIESYRIDKENNIKIVLAPYKNYRLIIDSKNFYKPGSGTVNGINFYITDNL